MDTKIDVVKRLGVVKGKSICTSNILVVKLKR